MREPFEVPATTPIVTAVADASAATLGRHPDVAGVSYWADSAFIAAADILTVLFGPAGDGPQVLRLAGVLDVRGPVRALDVATAG